MEAKSGQRLSSFSEQKRKPNIYKSKLPVKIRQTFVLHNHMRPTTVQPMNRRYLYTAVLVLLQIVILTAFGLRVHLVSYSSSVATVNASSSSIAAGVQGDSVAVVEELYENGILNVSSLDADNDCVQTFLERYSIYCEKAIVPSAKVIKEHDSIWPWRRKPVCPCMPNNLTGKVVFDLDALLAVNQSTGSTAEEKDLDDDRDLAGVMTGGHWSPSWCIPRQNIAIIVPYRDRQTQLNAFLHVMHPFLQKQMIQYTIFIVEQIEPWTFNKACLMNSGFREIVSRDHFDCFIFHDVDLLPEDDRNFYGCYKMPRHLGAYVDKWGYRFFYYRMFGGVTSLTKKQFEKANGYSNEFYGWGGEDDDMMQRISAAKMTFVRFPRCVGRYKMVRHKRDERNPSSHKGGLGWSYRPNVYKVNGLNSLRYTPLKYEKKRHYTWIAVSLPPSPTTTPPPTIQLTNTTTATKATATTTAATSQNN